jgi:hypothetical protein
MKLHLCQKIGLNKIAKQVIHSLCDWDRNVANFLQGKETLISLCESGACVRKKLFIFENN